MFVTKRSPSAVSINLSVAPVAAARRSPYPACSVLGPGRVLRRSRPQQARSRISPMVLGRGVDGQQTTLEPPVDFGESKNGRSSSLSYSAAAAVG